MANLNTNEPWFSSGHAKVSCLLRSCGHDKVADRWDEHRDNEEMLCLVFALNIPAFRDALVELENTHTGNKAIIEDSKNVRSIVEEYCA